MIRMLLVLNMNPTLEQIYAVIGIVIKEISAQNAVSTNDM